MVRAILQSLDLTRPQSEYFTDLLTMLLTKHEGSIVEIGCGIGHNTTLFCDIAAKFGRSVLVIDPFGGDMPESYRYSYDKFMQNMSGHGNWSLLRESSQDVDVCAKEIAIFEPIAFVFIDGLQDVKSVLSDMALMEQFSPAVMCIDDANRLTGDSRVPEALEAYTGKYKLIKQGREAYLCL